MPGMCKHTIKVSPSAIPNTLALGMVVCCKGVSHSRTGVWLWYHSCIPPLHSITEPYVIGSKII